MSGKEIRYLEIGETAHPLPTDCQVTGCIPALCLGTSSQSVRKFGVCGDVCLPAVAQNLCLALQLALAAIAAFRTNCSKSEIASPMWEQRFILLFVGGSIWLIAPKERAWHI